MFFLAPLFIHESFAESNILIFREDLVTYSHVEVGPSKNSSTGAVGVKGRAQGELLPRVINSTTNERSHLVKYITTIKSPAISQEPKQTKSPWPSQRPGSSLTRFSASNCGNKTGKQKKTVALPVVIVYSISAVNELFRYNFYTNLWSGKNHRSCNSKCRTTSVHSEHSKTSCRVDV